MSARSVHDELVEAAAEAICRPAHVGPDNKGSCVDCQAKAVLALRAAFAKLPECEAAVGVGMAALMESNQWEGLAVYARVHALRLATGDARTILAALAREFGDGEASRG